MNFKRLNFNWKRENKSQSLVELAIIFGILLLLLAGMVEFGNLLNQYINLVDGAREGARFGSNDDPFYKDPVTGVEHYQLFFGQIYQIVEGQFDSDGNRLTKGAINPLALDKNVGDDIVVTFFSITTHSPGAPTLERFVDGKNEANPMSRYNTPNRLLGFQKSDILPKIPVDTPNTGLVVVQIFYHYQQILRFIDFSSDPASRYTIAIQSYSIMPLSSAEPTPTPRP
jgi:hypothetical protein